EDFGLAGESGPEDRGRRAELAAPCAVHRAIGPSAEAEDREASYLLSGLSAQRRDRQRSAAGPRDPPRRSQMHSACRPGPDEPAAAPPQANPVLWVRPRPQPPSGGCRPLTAAAQWHPAVALPGAPLSPQ